ncbi:sensor histidine kinase family protein [Ekhidna sp.]
MKTLKYVPKNYVGSDLENIASVINIGYLLLTIFLTVSLFRQIIEAEFEIALIIALSILFTFFIRKHFMAGKLSQSVLLAVVFFNILLTSVCTLGSGINDIGIIGYPIIIGFSGIILDQRKLAGGSILSFLGVIWLVAGERLNLYSPQPISAGSEGDFVISSLFVFLGGFIAFNITNNMKRSLLSAQQEINISKKDSESLKKETNEKLEIIEEIHRAVINSLRHIQQLIEHRQKDSQELIPVYEGLKRKVLVIGVAHKILLSEQAPIMLDIRELTKQILSEYESQLKTPVLQIDIGNNQLFVQLDLAINYGICLLEMINKVDSPTNKKLSIALSISKDLVELRLTEFEIKEKYEAGIVMELLTKQLKGTLNQADNSLILNFKSKSI